MSRRTERVNELLRQEISKLMFRSIKDPRLSGVVTVTEVQTSTDLKHARVFISVLGSPEEKESALKGMRSASGYMRHELGGRLSLKHVPDFTFLLDHSLEEAQHIYDLLDDLEAGRQPEDDIESGPSAMDSAR